MVIEMKQMKQMKLLLSTLCVLFLASPVRAEAPWDYYKQCCFSMLEHAAPVGNPPADTAYVYLKDVAGVSTFVVKRSDGVEISLVAGGGGGAPTTATYITQTPDAGLSAEQALSGLASGFLLNTTGTGVLSGYGGTSGAANQWMSALSVSGVGTFSQPAFTQLTGTLGLTSVPTTNGQIPIWDSGSSAYVPGDPLVSGVGADGAAVVGNPVRIGGKDGSGNTQDIITDAAGVLSVNVLTAPSTTVTGPLTDAQLRATPLNVIVDSLPTVTVTDGVGALNVIVDSLPTVTVTDGAGALNVIVDSATVANLDVALSTRLKPADTLTAVTTVGTITNPVTVTDGVGALNVIVDSGAITNTPPANQSVNLNQIVGTAADVNSGLKSAGTLRVVLATDQPALTNKLLVTPDSVALPANQSVNLNQVAGVAVTTGSGTAAGAQRVEIANNGTGTIATVAAVTTVSTVTNLATIGTSVTPGTAAANLGKAEDAAHTSADTGVAMWGVRTDPTTTAYTTAVTEYSPVGVDYVGAGFIGAHPGRYSCFVPLTTTATTQCQAAAAAGLRNYVTDIVCSNGAATVQGVDIVYGTGAACVTGITALTHKFQMGTNGLTTSPFIVQASFNNASPLVPAAATAICVRPTAATAFGCTITGFTAP